MKRLRKHTVWNMRSIKQFFRDGKYTVLDPRIRYRYQHMAERHEHGTHMGCWGDYTCLIGSKYIGLTVLSKEYVVSEGEEPTNEYYETRYGYGCEYHIDVVPMVLSDVFDVMREILRADDAGEITWKRYEMEKKVRYSDNRKRRRDKIRRKEPNFFQPIPGSSNSTMNPKWSEWYDKNHENDLEEKKRQEDFREKYKAILDLQYGKHLGYDDEDGIINVN